MKYEIVGGSFPVVVCHLQQGEQMRTERGSMVWMDSCMQMETTGGGLENMLTRGLTGESILQNVYTAHANGKIAFGSSFPGRILPLEIGLGRTMIMQKQAFLASTMGVELSIYFHQNVGAGFFGGEGFIMQRFSGNGMAFVECDGDLVEYELAPGQQMLVDTGNLLGVQEGVSIQVQSVHGIKNMLLGGEGLFNTVLTGPGKVWMQTFSMASLAGMLSSATKGNAKKAEPSLLGGLLSA